MDIKTAVATCTSARQALFALGKHPYSFNYTWLYDQIKKHNLDTAHWKVVATQRLRMEMDDLASNSKRSRGTIRDFVLKHNLIPYVCAECSMPPMWKDRPLALRLDHINGVPDDNTLSNLRFVCPNCDAQSDTFAGRNTKRSKAPPRCCGRCGVEIGSRASYCNKCAPSLRAPKSKIQWPDHAELLLRLRTTSMLAIAKELGVSDNAVRKRILRYEKAIANGTEIRPANTVGFFGCGTVAGAAKCKPMCDLCREARNTYYRNRRKKHPNS